MAAGTNEPVFRDPWIVGLFAELAAAQERVDPAAWIDTWLKILVLGPYRDQVAPSVLARAREMVTDTVRHHVRPDMVAPTPVPGSWDRLGEIRVPALGVYGDQDAPDHVDMVKRFVDAVPGAALAVVPHAGHLPNMERPAEFTGILLDFLRTTFRRAA